VLETPEVDKEYKRMVKEGAKAIKAPYEMEKMLIATLEDPDGNYFQLMSPWKEEK
jgi:predicted enzyme related to lactoylglutathione lyase